MIRPLQPVALTAVLLSTARAAAFGVQLQNGNVVHWPQTAVTYWLDANGTSDITDGSDLAAVRAAVQTWNSVGCSSFSLSEAGVTFSTQNVATDNVTDGKNVVVWIEDSRWSYGQLVLGVTAPVFDSNGNIEEADVAFNGYSAHWSTDGSATDVQSVATHELGHFLGLAHVLGGASLADPPTMSPTVLPHLASRSLNADDMSGACFLYPKSPYHCSVNCDCPTIVARDSAGQEYNAAQAVCDAGVCSTGTLAATTLGALGTSCVDSSSCTDGLFCQPTDYGSYCAQNCDPATNNCPAGFACWPYSNSTGGACLPNGLGSGNDASGTVCQASVAASAAAGGGTPVGAARRPASDTSTSAAGFVPACACDTTYDCDPACSCDPDCSGGCAALPQTGAAPATMPLGLLLTGLVFGVARRRRTR